jgi:hypothetical protein
MKPVQFTLHPSSALAGAFLLALCLVTLGAFAPQGSSSGRDVNLTSVLGQPSPHDNITIFSGTPYTVPNDKQFVLTSLGSRQGANTEVFLRVDDTRRVCSYGAVNETNVSVKNIPDFVIVPYGSVITVEQTLDRGVATGYLIDA